MAVPILARAMTERLASQSRAAVRFRSNIAAVARLARGIGRPLTAGEPVDAAARMALDRAAARFTPHPVFDPANTIGEQP